LQARTEAGVLELIVWEDPRQQKQDFIGEIERRLRKRQMSEGGRFQAAESVAILQPLIAPRRTRSMP
jgi:hypothetical protein